MLLPLCALSQNGKTDKSKTKPSAEKIGIGLKAGLNFANVTGVSSVSSKNKTGFMIGGFYSPPSKGLFGFRMEFDYSRQGYDFKTNTNTGTVNQDYILMPTLTVINLGKVAQLHLGPQTAFLLNAKADTTSTQSSSDPYANAMTNITKYQNRVSMGATAGFEIYPYKGILIGARYNVSFGDMFKTPTSSTTPAPSFLSVNAKNNLVQFFLGYRF
jgi:hypothetical protein